MKGTLSVCSPTQHPTPAHTHPVKHKSIDAHTRLACCRHAPKQSGKGPCVCFLEGLLWFLSSYGRHDIFVGCCHASLLGSLLGLVEILELYLHSSGWATGSDTFWSSWCCVELDSFRSRLFSESHISKELGQTQTTWLLYDTALNVRFYYMFRPLSILTTVLLSVLWRRCVWVLVKS